MTLMERIDAMYRSAPRKNVPQCRLTDGDMGTFARHGKSATPTLSNDLRAQDHDCERTWLPESGNNIRVLFVHVHAARLGNTTSATLIVRDKHNGTKRRLLRVDFDFNFDSLGEPQLDLLLGRLDGVGAVADVASDPGPPSASASAPIPQIRSDGINPIHPGKRVEISRFGDGEAQRTEQQASGKRNS